MIYGHEIISERGILWKPMNTPLDTYVIEIYGGHDTSGLGTNHFV